MRYFRGNARDHRDARAARGPGTKMTSAALQTYPPAPERFEAKPKPNAKAKSDPIETEPEPNANANQNGP